MMMMMLYIYICNTWSSDELLVIKWNEKDKNLSEHSIFIGNKSQSPIKLVYYITWSKNSSTSINNLRGCLRGVMVKAMDCGIVVREFVLQSRYYIHFRANTLGKGMNPLILPGMG